MTNVDEPVTVVGTGPAGMAAAITLHDVGMRVRLVERHAGIAHRFHGDFQGLENWTQDCDVLQEISRLGIEVRFQYHPFHQVNCLAPDGTLLQVNSQQPLFYLLRRGPQSGTLDSALLEQVLERNIEIRFNESVHTVAHGGIACIGPHRADALAVGYVFETHLPDGAWCAVSDRLAPQGYAYLLIADGRATLACCLFADFQNKSHYLQQTQEFFSRYSGLDLSMRNPRRFGGLGNFYIPVRLAKGRMLYAGESAGIQDPLFGFGLRCAIQSAVAAARAWAKDDLPSYQHFYERELRPRQRVALCNRWFYRRLGNRGYKTAFDHYRADQDIRLFLQRIYRPRRWKQLWSKWVAERDYRPPRSTIDSSCDCIWCRCAVKPD